MKSTNPKAIDPAAVATVKQVAERAGVSTATVSRVMSGAGGVRESLRARVLEAARLLSYRPNPAARDLRVRSRRIVGVLIPDIENPFFTRVICGIEDALRETDYSLLLANFNENPELEARGLETFLSEGVCGLIFAASQKPSSLYSELGDRVAMVAVSRVPPRLRIDQVTVANRDGAYQAVSHLIELGHKRIAMINGPEVLTTARDRRAGYDDGLREAGLPIDESLVAHCDFRQAAGHQAMQQLLALAPQPTAVFAASNLLTLGALQSIHEAQLDIPRQMAIVGFDEMPWAMSLRPPLTTVEQPAFEVGRTAAQLLLDRLHKPETPRRQIILGTRLLVRSSCGSDSRPELVNGAGGELRAGTEKQRRPRLCSV